MLVLWLDHFIQMLATWSIHLVHIGKRSTALFLLKATEEELKMCRTRRGGVSHTRKMYLAKSLVFWYIFKQLRTTMFAPSRCTWQRWASDLLFQYIQIVQNNYVHTLKVYPGFALLIIRFNIILCLHIWCWKLGDLFTIQLSSAYTSMPNSHGTVQFL